MSYYVVEIFRTLQGEGFHAGTASVFVRFAGCNLWTGHDEHRARDAEANRVRCPTWCDTDFRKGKRYEAQALAHDVAFFAKGGVRHIVFTGGEPLLQLDANLVREIRRAFPDFVCLAVETNGTTRPSPAVEPDWVCVSPKVSMDLLQITHADELKVVFPDYHPSDYEPFAADHYFVSPRARVLPNSVGRSLLDADNTQRAAQFCIDNPRWRLSLQTHKQVGIP